MKRERQAAAAAARASPNGPPNGNPNGTPLVDCYFAALCKSSACDEVTRDLSLFHLVIDAKHPLTEFGLSASYTPVFLLESQSTGFEIDVRVVWQPVADAPTEVLEEPTRISIQCSRTYLRKRTCFLPSAPGTYDLMLDWRPIGGTWTRTSARFPVLFEER